MEGQLINYLKPVFALLLFALSVNVVQAKQANDRFIGSWSGCLVSGGIKLPAVTHIQKSGNSLKGSYSFLEDSGVVVFGKLTTKSVSNNLLSMFWKDKYGTGELQMKFSATQFIGRWKDDGTGQWQGSWDGKRVKGLIPKVTECAPLVG